MKNMTNTNPSNATANVNVNFRAPIRTEIPVTINFNAPINLTYNGGKEKLEKITSADLQRYIEEQTAGQCETVPAGWPAPIVPASKKNSCTAPTNNPATNVPTDKPVKNDAKKTGCGVAEATVENRIMDAIVGKFGVPRNWLISITPFKSCYNMYAVGTTGDLTYLAWVHSDGRITVKQQAW